MTANFKILAQFVKDMSSETPDVQTYLFVKERILKYQLQIDINSKPVKKKIIEVNTILRFEDNKDIKKRSVFEIIYTSIVKIDDEVENKKDMEKIILCDVQNLIYPNLEKTFINLLHNSGFPEVKFEKKIDFNKLFIEKSN